MTIEQRACTSLEISVGWYNFAVFHAIGITESLSKLTGHLTDGRRVLQWWLGGRLVSLPFGPLTLVTAT